MDKLTSKITRLKLDLSNKKYPKNLLHKPKLFLPSQTVVTNVDTEAQITLLYEEAAFNSFKIIVSAHENALDLAR